MSIASQFLDTADIQRPKRVRDGYNEETLLWPPDAPIHLTGVRGRLVVKMQRVADSVIAERPVVTTYRWLTGATVDVRQGDRLVNIVFRDGTADAGPYRISEVMMRRGASKRHLSLLLEKQG